MAAALVPAASFAADGMRDGQWEITTVMEMPGMPFKIPPQVTTHCFTKEDVKDQKSEVKEEEKGEKKDAKHDESKTKHISKSKLTPEEEKSREKVRSEERKMSDSKQGFMKNIRGLFRKRGDF